MKLCNRIIEYSFYSLFLLVPLVFSGSTSELFEFNKMWLTFGLTIIITTAWLSKMVLQRRIFIQRTPLDIPLMLFLLSQVIATLFSLDQHVSWWGYYSRFNGGLLSTICYIVLYYAFVSNLSVKHVLRTLSVTLASGVVVALWGFPSHFGADPTCLVFRGSLDTSCWTEAFKPTVRIFSTLGQPAWLAAYLTVLIPLTIAYALNNAKSPIRFWGLVGMTMLLYLCLIFANTRAAFIAFFVINILFWAFLFYKKIFSVKKYLRYFLIFNLLFLLCSFFPGSPIGGLFTKFFSPQEMISMTAPPVMAEAPTTSPSPNPPPPTTSGITDSGKIRLYVWTGAIEAWKANPIFGTGVETFAFTYYQHKPPGHNTTSEWDYLYNKAHNEYLNYLATTGAFGLGTHLLMIIMFLWIAILKLDGRNWKFEKEIRNSKLDHQTSNLKLHHPASNIQHQTSLIIIALLAGYISIIITNFFNFSVVMMNIFLFLIPAFVFILADMLNPKKILAFPSGSFLPSEHSHINPYQWTALALLVAVAGYLLLGLFRYWYADVSYALGNNLDKAGGYQDAYPQLLQAVKTIPNEPVYQDELSINLGTLATALYMQKDATNGEQFAREAIGINNQVVQNHPNNVVYWKNRVRLFYTLAQGDSKNQQQYLQEALLAIQKAHELAPTDAKIAYNLGVLYGQNGEFQKGIDLLQKTIELKPDYRDAYVALGLSYHTMAVDKNNKVINPNALQKAIETYEYILKNITPEDKQVKDNLRLWKQEK